MMKLSFSTRYMPEMSLSDYLKTAQEQKYSAVEIYDIFNACFNGDKASFSKEGAFSTKRKLLNTGIAISAFQMPFDISDFENEEENLAKAIKIIEAAADINVGIIKVHAEKSEEKAKEFLEKILPKAFEEKVVIAIETTGVFSNSSVLRDVLEYFASDSIAAAWNMYSTYFFGEEDAEATIKNLGAYVKTVSILDADKNKNPVLIGEGVLPIEEMINALRSVNYNGFV